LCVGLFAAVALTIFGALNVASAVLSSRKIPKSSASAFSSHEIGNAKLNACKREFATLHNYTVNNSTPKTPKYIWSQNTITVANPFSRDALGSFPPNRALTRWKYDYFYAYLTVLSSDLFTSEATLQLTLIPGVSKQRTPYAPALPRGTTYSLRVYTTSRGYINIPISPSVDNSKKGAIVNVPVTLIGQQSGFPVDTYVAQIVEMFVEVTVPGRGSTGLEVDAGYVSKSQDVSAEITAVPGVNLGFKDLETCNSGFSLVFRRPLDGKMLWLALMSLLPLGFLPLIFSSSRSKGRSDGKSVAATALGLLSILALRSVLVPTTFPAPTTLDYLLGADMTALIAALTLGQLLNLRTPRHQQETDLRSRMDNKYSESELTIERD
jgi:hypothetical protein